MLINVSGWFRAEPLAWRANATSAFPAWVYNKCWVSSCSTYLKSSCDATMRCGSKLSWKPQVQSVVKWSLSWVLKTRDSHVPDLAHVQLSTVVSQQPPHVCILMCTTQRKHSSQTMVLEHFLSFAGHFERWKHHVWRANLVQLSRTSYKPVFATHIHKCSCLSYSLDAIP